MNKKSRIIAIIIGLIVLILPIILYFAAEVSDESALPEQHSLSINTGTEKELIHDHHELTLSYCLFRGFSHPQFYIYRPQPTEDTLRHLRID